MDIGFLERLLEVFERASLAEVELSEGGWRIRLTRAAMPPATEPAHVNASSQVDPRTVAAPSRPAPAAETYLIRAGFVGTFYRRPNPDSPPFVVVGDVVEDGQILGIMEAMKTLIGVEADRAGRISEIYVEDGSSVQLGDPLVALSPTSQP